MTSKLIIKHEVTAGNRPALIENVTTSPLLHSLTRT
nr:MAG TPA: hypothetical protein [Caudoviricetes sp.]